MINPVIVCYNDLERLKCTLSSVINNPCVAQIWVKDGDSTDGTVTWLRSQNIPNLTIIKQRDAGIYDAMNQALDAIKGGGWFTFLNCGDQLLINDVANLEKYKILIGSVAMGQRWFDIRIIQPTRNFRKRSWMEIFFHHQGFLFKISKETPRFFTDLGQLADNQWMLEFVKQCDDDAIKISGNRLISLCTWGGVSDRSILRRIQSRVKQHRINASWQIIKDFYLWRLIGKFLFRAIYHSMRRSKY